jgi:hypothetical protein
MKKLAAIVCANAFICASTWAAPFFSVDVNDRTVADIPNTVEYFHPFLMTGTTAATADPVVNVIESYTVTLTPWDDNLDQNTAVADIQNTAAQIDDRDRSTPVNAGSFTYAQIYDDFIFAGQSAGPSGGMDLTVSGGLLQPNTQYLVSIYAFDSGSTPLPQPRVANWLDGNNSDLLVLTTSFEAAVLPTANDTYKFTGIAQTDATGTLFLKGRNATGYQPDGAVSPGVFLNGFEISMVPEPTALSLILLGGLLALFRRR